MSGMAARWVRNFPALRTRRGKVVYPVGGSDPPVGQTQTPVGERRPTSRGRDAPRRVRRIRTNEMHKKLMLPTGTA